MNGSHWSAAGILACGSAVVFLVFASNASGCLNEYDKKEHQEREYRQKQVADYMDQLASGSKLPSTPSPDRLEQLRIGAESEDFRAKSDYAVALIRLGEVKQAIEILQAVEQQQPGEYIVAANLGTAYELAGDDQKALKWITTGLRRNPDSHAKSEWLHVKILQAKLAHADDPSWFKSHSIVGLDFGTESEPIRPSQPATDLDGHAIKLEDVRAALEYQLHERISLVAAPDGVVSSLLTDLGNLLVLDGSLEHAMAVFNLGSHYADYVSPQIQRRIRSIARIQTASVPFVSERRLVLVLIAIVGILGFFMIAAIAVYLKRFARRLFALPPRR